MANELVQNKMNNDQLIIYSANYYYYSLENLGKD